MTSLLTLKLYFKIWVTIYYILQWFSLSMEILRYAVCVRVRASYLLVFWVLFLYFKGWGGTSQSLSNYLQDDIQKHPAEFVGNFWYKLVEVVERRYCRFRHLDLEGVAIKMSKPETKSSVSQSHRVHGRNSKSGKSSQNMVWDIE